MKQTKETKHKAKQKTRIVFSFLKSSLPIFAISILAAAVSAFADMISPQIIRVTIDNVLGGIEPELPDFIMSWIASIGGMDYIAKNLWIMALAVIAVALVSVSVQYIFRVSNTKASETLVKTMRDRLFGHIERLPYSWHMKNQTGDIIQRCTSDIDTLKRFLSEQMTSIFRIVILLILSLSFMIPMNPLLTLVAIIPMPIILLYSFTFHKKIGKGFRECDENEGLLSAMVQENLTGVRVVRAFGRERYEKDKFDKHNEYYTSLWVRLSKTMSRFWSTSDILSGIQIMLIVVVGAVLCVNDRMNSGEYIAFISYNSMLVWPVRMLGRMISELSKAGVSIDRICDIMNEEIEKDNPNALTPPLDKDIAFNNVSFAYDGCPEILHNVSFTMKAGTTLGILGGTGSGKSTLMHLLDRLYDIPEGCGSITIGGVDIADIKTDYLRAGIGMVLQEPFLFSRTIAENISITSDKITESDVRDAAKTACLDGAIENFTKGYDTFVGERGVTLSGGQKQRAAIARMLTQKTPIMVFDDSLSAVDTETDAKIRHALEQKFGTASIILISHRITTLSKADKIIVLDKGRIAEEGTHETLKSSGGIYSRIYAIQTGGIEEVNA